MSALKMAGVVQLDNTDAILSNELLAELGGNEDVLLASKKHNKRKRTDEPSEEVKLIAKQLSKKAQKRVNQIKKRKEKEAQRSDFIDIIHKHEISEAHRQLLVSSKDIGQSQTLKQLLSSIYRKQQAGIQLSLEETHILYSQKDANLSEGEFPFMECSSTLPPPQPVDVASNICDGSETLPHTEVLFSFDDILPVREVDNVIVQVRNKNKKKRTNGGEPSADSNNDVNNFTEQPLSKTTVGSGLLAQLQHIKQSKQKNSIKQPEQYKHLCNVNIDTNSQLVIGHCNSTNVTSIIENTHSAAEVYVVSLTPDPVTSQGDIVNTMLESRNVKLETKSSSSSSISKHNSMNAEATNNQTEMNVAVPIKDSSNNNLFPSSSTSVCVNRSIAIQAARMALPVCAMEQEVLTLEQ